MLQAERHAFGDYKEALESYFDRGWTDGLPIVPPTPEDVQGFLDYAGLKPDEILGAVPTREVTVTAEQVAINAVMAGCKAQYMPVVVASVIALCEEKANFHSTTGTLGGASHAVIVNGPIRNEIGIHSKAGCFGPGWRANATIGRALRLVIRNVGRAIPGFLDRAAFSTPARYSFCFGENEEDSPWLPLHVERGLPNGSDSVTVQSCLTMQSVWELRKSPEAVLDSICKAFRTKGVAGDRWLENSANVVVVMGTEHMRVFAEAGWSKKDMREYLYPKAVAPRQEGEGSVKLGSPEGVLFVAAGGPAVPESWILFPHLAWAVTKPIEPGGR